RGADGTVASARTAPCPRPSRKPDLRGPLPRSAVARVRSPPQLSERWGPARTTAPDGASQGNEARASRARTSGGTERAMTGQNDYVRWFDDLGRQDVPSVGGKNASLGEMITALGGQGIRVP